MHHFTINQLVELATVNSFYDGHRRDRPQLSVSERCPPYRESRKHDTSTSEIIMLNGYICLKSV